MSNNCVKIDGLSPQQYKILMTPLREEPYTGKMGSRKVNFVTHSLRTIANFFSRVYYSIFITHKWETDHNLMHRLWRDLTKTKTAPVSVKLQEIKKIFQSLALRLPATDKEKIRVEQKLISLDQQKGPIEEPTEPILSGSSHTPLDKLIEKLNGQANRKSRNVYECREKILQSLFQEKMQSKLIESVLKKVKFRDDKTYFKAYAQILGDLGIEHPILKDGLNIAHLIHTLNSDESEFRKEVREMVLSGLVDDAKKAGLTMEHFQKIINALTNSSDKEYLKKILTTPEKKKSGLMQ